MADKEKTQEYSKYGKDLYVKFEKSRRRYEFQKENLYLNNLHMYVKGKPEWQNAKVIAN